MDLLWSFDLSRINWEELAELITIAPLTAQSPEYLKTVFSNSQFFCFVFHSSKIVGSGRALSDGLDCAYISHIAVHPDYQGIGLGSQIIKNLVEQTRDHSKIILYANPGLEDLYRKYGFKKMNTAMGIFKNEGEMIRKGVLSE
jgi:ribosomal protein S18 acetylase RimI-like enzyme